jgi:putative copper export protein
MIAPVVITALFAGYLVFYFRITTRIVVSPVVRLALGAVLLALLGAMVGVLVGRIKEIRRGEEDDLSQY